MQSTTLPISCGVPQGSILGPLLFIITMNDIGNVSEFLYTILYADDTCVLLNGNDYLSLIASLNSELDKLSIWLCANKLSLNVQKTDSLKYLGVIIDHRLNWSHHITHVKNMVSKGIGIMYRARRYLTKSSLRKLYFSYIYPYLIYCIEIWGILPKVILDLYFFYKRRL